MAKNLEGYINLTLVVLKKETTEDLLLIRECDICAIKEVIASLTEGRIKAINKLFGLEGEEIRTFDQVKDLLYSTTSTGASLRESIRMIQRRSGAFRKLSRSLLERDLDEKSKTIEDLRKELASAEARLKQVIVLAELNNDNLQYGNTEAKEARKLIVANILDVNIENMLGFSVRTQRCLKEAGIITIKDLISKKDIELLALPQFGRKSLNEINDFLQSAGLKLGFVEAKVNIFCY